MRAIFKNGHTLEVRVVDQDYRYDVHDEENNLIEEGWTEYRSIDLYYPMNEIDYIVTYCEPVGCEGEYEIVKGEEK